MRYSEYGIIYEADLHSTTSRAKVLVLTLGEKRHATVTLAERLMVTDMEVILSGT